MAIQVTANRGNFEPGIRVHGYVRRYSRTGLAQGGDERTQVFHKRSKHIDIKYHWIREHVNPGGFETAQLHHCRTDRMAADIFTKSLIGSLFFEHAKTITGKQIRSSEEFVRNAKRARR